MQRCLDRTTDEGSLLSARRYLIEFIVVADRIHLLNEIRGETLLKAIADGHEHLPAVLLDERGCFVGHEQRGDRREVDRRRYAGDQAKAIADVISMEEFDEVCITCI